MFLPALLSPIASQSLVATVEAPAIQSICSDPNNATTLNVCAKIAERERLLGELINCESGNRWNIRIVDTNGLYSYSGLQFQLNTFYSFGAELGLFKNKQEALGKIYEPETQKEVARYMIEKGVAQYHWKICYSRITRNGTFIYY
jgi:hypothetical protein